MGNNVLVKLAPIPMAALLMEKILGFVIGPIKIFSDFNGYFHDYVLSRYFVFRLKRMEKSVRSLFASSDFIESQLLCRPEYVHKSILRQSAQGVRNREIRLYQAWPLQLSQFYSIYRMEYCGTENRRKIVSNNNRLL